MLYNTCKPTHFLEHDTSLRYGRAILTPTDCCQGVLTRCKCSWSPTFMRNVLPSFSERMEVAPKSTVKLSSWGCVSLEGISALFKFFFFFSREKRLAFCSKHESFAGGSRTTFASQVSIKFSYKESYIGSPGWGLGVGIRGW
jgi:hypothetical protein